MKRIAWGIVLFAAAIQAAAPLVPRPREVEYRDGRFVLEGAAVRFASEPAAEDTFAARELARLLSRHAAVTEGATGARAIVLERTGAIDALPGRDDRSGPDGREAYTIEISAERTLVRARSSAGLYYGALTLAQMAEGEGAAAFLPVSRVRDWPALPYRGFMMDTAHGSLPTEDEIKRQIDFLAQWKANQYYFYSEANIELDGYELVNPTARYTKAQVRRIIEYARERHVDVVPCVELFGHIHDVLKLERYAGYSPLRYGGEFRVRDERVRKLLADWVAQLGALFPSEWIHVGFDEPWGLRNYATAEAKEPEAAKLFLEHLRYTAGLVTAQKKRLALWGDVQTGSQIFEEAKVLRELPQGTVVVPWDYDPKPDYGPQVKPLVTAGATVVVATGIWNWNEIAPDLFRTFDNIDGFVAAAKRDGAVGILNTGWTDSAQVLFRMALPAMAYGAAAGWQSGPVDRARFFGEYAALVYPQDAAPDCAAAMEALARSEQLYLKAVGGPTIHRLWDDPLDAAKLAKIRTGLQQLRAGRLAAEDAQERLLRVAARHPDAPGVRAMLVGSRILDYFGMKHLYALQMTESFDQARKNPTGDALFVLLEMGVRAQDHGMLADLEDSASELREEFRTAWLEEYTSFRLSAALMRWNMEFEYWRRLQARVERLLDHRNEKDPIPALDTLRERQ